MVASTCGSARRRSNFYWTAPGQRTGKLPPVLVCLGRTPQMKCRIDGPGLWLPVGLLRQPRSKPVTPCWPPAADLKRGAGNSDDCCSGLAGNTRQMDFGPVGLTTQNGAAENPDTRNWFLPDCLARYIAISAWCNSCSGLNALSCGKNVIPTLADTCSVVRPNITG